MKLYQYQEDYLAKLPPSCIMAADLGTLTEWYTTITMFVMNCLDCAKKVVARGYCDTHYRKRKKTGNLLPSTQAPRLATIENNIAKIPLGLNAKHGYAIVDANIVSEFEKYLWTVSKGYAVRNNKENSHVFMHQCIKGKAPKGLVIDHINGNKLDNRASNIRFITQQQNTFNKTSSGVTWRKDRNKWMARIKVSGKTIFLGHFDTKKEAQTAYIVAKAKHHVI